MSGTTDETKSIQEESIEIDVWDKKNKKYNPTKINLGKEPTIQDYIKNLETSDILEVGGFKESMNSSGYSTIIKEPYKKQKQWIYILTITGKIMKIGLTTKTLDSRWGSYSAGVKENRRNGTCSTTNYHISELVRNSLKKDYDIKLYGYIIPHTYNNIKILGEDVSALSDHTKLYESKFIEKFKKFYGRTPIVGKNFQNN